MPTFTCSRLNLTNDLPNPHSRYIIKNTRSKSLPYHMAQTRIHSYICQAQHLSPECLRIHFHSICLSKIKERYKILHYTIRRRCPTTSRIRKSQHDDRRMQANGQSQNLLTWNTSRKLRYLGNQQTNSKSRWMATL